MWPFAIASILAFGFYEYVVKPNMASSQVGGPPAKETFTSGGKIKIGDVVTVSMVSVEPNSSETALDTSPDQKPVIPTEAELRILDALEQTAFSGGTADLLVTATGLTSKGSSGAVPVSIGVLQVAGVSTRIPAVFLTASVQRIVRDGKVVT